MKDTFKKAPLAYLLIIPTVILLLVFIWFKDGYLLGTAESALPFYNLERYFNITRWAWAYPALGNATGIFSASAPTYYILSIFQKAGIPGFILEAFLFWFLISIGGTFMIQLTKLSFPKISKPFVVFSGLFYIFNLFTLANIWQRFLYNYFFFWAFLPVFLYIYLLGLKRKNYVYALILPLVSLIFSYSFTSTPFLILLLFLAAFTSIFYWTIGKNSLFYLLKYNLIVATVFGFTNSWWINQLFSFIFSSGYTSAVSNFFSSKGNIDTVNILSKKLGIITNVTRLYHGTAFIDSNSWMKYFSYFPLSYIFFTAPLISFYTLLKNKKNLSVLYFSLLFLIGIFLAKGSNPPFGEMYTYIFSNITFLQVFRNPFEKFGFLLTLAVAPVFSYGLHLLSRKASTVNKAIISLGILTLLISSLPFWTRDVLKAQSRVGERINYEVKVPTYYKEANQWLNNQGDAARMVVLPLGDEGITYDWEENYSGVELTNTLFDKPAISFNTTIPYYSEIARNIEKSFMELDVLKRELYLLNVKYVLYRPDINWKLRGMRDPEEIINKLQGSKELIRDNQFGPLMFWVNSQWVDNKIGVANKLINNLPYSELNDVKFLKESSILHSSAKQGGNLDHYEVMTVYKPINNFFMDSVSMRGFEERQDIFPHINYLPSNPIHSLVSLKENINLSLLSGDDLALKMVSYLGKRLSEVDRGIDANDKESINLALRDYKILVKDLTEEVLILNRESIAVNNRTWNQENLYNIFIRHSNALNEFLSRTNDEGVKNTIVNTHEYLRDFLSTTEIAPYYDYLVLDDFSVDKRRTYQFDIDKAGSYDVYLEGEDWEKYFALNEIDNFKVQLNKDLIEFNKTLLTSKDIFLGTYSWEPGIYEFGWNTSPRKELIDASNNEYTLRVEHGVEEMFFQIKNYDSYSKYEISFDYWVRVGGGLDFSFRENNDVVKDGELQPHFEKHFSPDNYYRDVKNYSIIIDPDDRSDSAQIVFSAKPVNECVDIFRTSGILKCKDEAFRSKFDKTTEIILKNIHVYKTMDAKPYILRVNDNKVGKLPQVTYNYLNPTSYEVIVQNATDPFLLVFSELFNSEWKAILEGGSEIAESNHFVANIYANAWLIDKKGNYKIQLLYKPQILLNYSKTISYASTGFLIVILIAFKIFKINETKK